MPASKVRNTDQALKAAVDSGPAVRYDGRRLTLADFTGVLATKQAKLALTLSFKGCGIAGVKKSGFLSSSKAATLDPLWPWPTKVKVLNLAGNSFSGSLAPLRSHIHLVSLDLSSCPHLRGDLGPLAGMTKLINLNLFNCGALYGDLDALRGMGQLTRLNLSYCTQLKGSLAKLDKLANLERLDIFGCTTLTDVARFVRQHPECQVSASTA